MNMIEKAARAIWSAKYTSDWDKDVPLDRVIKEACIEEAKVTILAMREPTEEMLSVDFKNDYIVGEGNQNHDRLRNLVIFQAMIDAALKEGDKYKC